jgi:hypothetical protein
MLANVTLAQSLDAYRSAELGRRHQMRERQTGRNVPAPRHITSFAERRAHLASVRERRAQLASLLHTGRPVVAR